MTGTKHFSPFGTWLLGCTLAFGSAFSGNESLAQYSGYPETNTYQNVAQNYNSAANAHRQYGNEQYVPQQQTQAQAQPQRQQTLQAQAAQGSARYGGNVAASTPNVQRGPSNVNRTPQRQVSERVPPANYVSRNENHSPVRNQGPYVARNTSTARPATGNRQVNYQAEAVTTTAEQAPQPPVSNPSVRIQPEPKKQESLTQTLQLREISTRRFEATLRNKLKDRCPIATDFQGPENHSQLRLETVEGTTLTLTMDHQANTIRVEGSRNAIGSFMNIVKLLDVRETSSQIQTDLVPYSKANYRAVRRTVNALEQTQDNLPISAPMVNGNVNPNPNPNVNVNSTDPRAAQNREMPFIGNGEQQGLGFELAPDARTIADTNAMLGQMAQIGLIGQVQLEVFGEFGFIAIRGSERDVEIVKQLIQLIEQVGVDQEPEIVIYPMVHTDCVRLGILVRLFYNEIYGPRRGNINITPLVKPNALILVGKKESIETAIELIKKLDIDVDPNHGFKVVRLKNAVATAVQQTLTNHFSYASQDGQMYAKVVVTVDARTNSLIIQGSPRDLAEAVALIEKIDSAESEAQSVVQIFKLLNSSASDLATMLQNGILGSSTGTFNANTNQRSVSLEFLAIDTREREVLRSGIISSDIRITPETRSNSVMVVAPKDTMPLIAALIKELDDLPVAQSQVKVFQLLNGDATSLYNTLQTLFQTQTTGTAGTNTLVSRPGITDGESTMVQLRFSPDVRTNSIIAVGTAGDLEMVQMLLTRLDDEHMQQRNRFVRVFRLLNAPASEVSTVLNNYIREESTIDTTDSELFSIYEQYQREVVVVEDNVTNSVIVSTTPRYFEMIRRIIRELDERPPMVVIQVLVAEVTISNLDELGVEFGLQDSILFDRGSDSPGFNFNTTNPLGTDVVRPENVGTQGITNLGLGRAGSTGVGGFVFSASSESVSVLLRALNERGKVNVLSRPEVTALDNQRASVTIGQRVPYIAGTDMSDGIVSNSTDFMDAGLILDVTPRINTDGLVTMNIYVEKSTVDMAASTLGPTKSQSCVQTYLSAMDGQTVVIGGMITTEDTQSTVAVPFISNIPVVGRLFEYNSKKCTRKELLVIMTPTIIRSEEDMNRVRMMEIRRMHWCSEQVRSIYTARDLRQRGDNFTPGESEVIRYDGYRPSEEMLPRLEGVHRVNELDPYRQLPGLSEQGVEIFFEDVPPTPLRPHQSIPEPRRAPEPIQ